MKKHQAPAVTTSAERYLQQKRHCMKQLGDQWSEEIKENGERFKALFKEMSVPLFVWRWTGEDFILIDYNNVVDKITCGKISAMLGKAATKSNYHNRPDVIESIKLCFEKRMPVKDEKSIQTTAGKRKIFAERYDFIPPDMVVLRTEDITAQKLAEDKVRASEAELRALFGVLTDVIAVLDINGRYLKIAPTNPALLCLPPAELLGKTLHEVFPFSVAENFVEYIRSVLKTGKPLNIEYSLLIDQRVVCFEATISQISEEQVFWIARDVTEHKHMDAQLQESLMRLSVLYDIYRKTSQELDIDDLVRETLSLLRKHLEVDGIAFFLVDEDAQDVMLHSALGLSEELVACLRSGLDSLAILKGLPKVLKVKDAPNWKAKRNALKHGFTDVIRYPLIAGGKVVGSIAITNKNDRPIQEKDQELLMAICSQLGTTLQNAKLFHCFQNELAVRTKVQADLHQSEERYRLLAEAAGGSVSGQSKRKPVYLNAQDYGVFSDKTREVVLQAQKYAADRSLPVLIHGETGTGKEQIARMIHGVEPSEHRKKPFVDINCAAITASLFESELFGYEPGAFTGGLSKGQIGKLELAAGGTLFLDEISEMPLEIQAKLLRVIQEKEYYRVGGLKKVPLNVRIVCTTNVNLLQAVAEGKFRKDLYYRLKVGYIHLLPLRERPEEIVPLCLMFLQDFARQKGKSFNAISASAAKLLSSYEWPGNIRELRNTMDWVVFMHDDVTLEPRHLDIIRAGKPVEAKEDCNKNPGFEAMWDGSENLRSYTDQIVMRVLETHGGNKTAAARELGISRRALYRILERFEGENAQN